MVPPAVFEVATGELTGWLDGVQRRHARVGVLGLGYVGLPLSLLFADAGFRVTGFDVDTEKIAKLNRGESYIWRIEREHVQDALTAGFHATSDFSAVAQMDALLICVPTPLTGDHIPDLSYVEQTVQAIAPHLHDGQLVVLESTTYPGTTEEVVVRAIEAAGHHVLRGEGDGLNGVMVAFSPEREDPGNLEVERKDVPKVVGGCDPRALAAASGLYGSIFSRTVPVSSPATAEMTKLLENIYRAVNIALVNEMKQLCLRMGVDIWEVIDAAATKPFGFQPFYPGPGIGGHCIPVDPFYLTWKAKEYGFPTRFIQLAGEVNESMPGFVVDQLQHSLKLRGKSLSASKVLVLGVAYKPDIDDLRESPSLRILDLLQKAGTDVSYHDPFFPVIGRGRKYDLPMRCATLDDLSQYDAVLIATHHSTYDYARIVEESQLVVDTRNATRGIHSDKIVRC